MSIIIQHNFISSKFMWLYAKYAHGCNPAHHCTNAIQGKYSKNFSKRNLSFKPENAVVMNEFPETTWDAIYICGVSSNGYSKKMNYSHNVHVAILPKEGSVDHWEFENWVMDIKNGIFEYVPSQDEIDPGFLRYPFDYRTCRMFRWAVWHYHESPKKTNMIKTCDYCKKFVCDEDGDEYCEIWGHYEGQDANSCEDYEEENEDE